MANAAPKILDAYAQYKAAGQGSAPPPDEYEAPDYTSINRIPPDEDEGPVYTATQARLADARAMQRAEELWPGRTEPLPEFRRSTPMPTWVKPVAIGAAALILIAALKR